MGGDLISEIKVIHMKMEHMFFYTVFFYCVTLFHFSFLKCCSVTWKISAVQWLACPLNLDCLHGRLSINVVD